MPCRRSIVVGCVMINLTSQAEQGGVVLQCRVQQASKVRGVRVPDIVDLIKVAASISCSAISVHYWRNVTLLSSIL